MAQATNPNETVLPLEATLCFQQDQPAAESEEIQLHPEADWEFTPFGSLVRQRFYLVHSHAVSNDAADLFDWVVGFFESNEAEIRRLTSAGWRYWLTFSISPNVANSGQTAWLVPPGSAARLSSWALPIGLMIE